MGIRYRPFSLTMLVFVCSCRSGTMRQNLADERVEPLGIDAAVVALVARTGIARAEIHHPPIGVAATVRRG